jgi:hypothetical protein
MSQNTGIKSMNSILPLGVTNSINTIATNMSKNASKMMPSMPNLPAMPNMPTVSSIPWLGLLSFVALVSVILILLYYFNQQVNDGMNKINASIRTAFGMHTQPPPPPAPMTAVTAAPPDIGASNTPPNSVVEKILPQGGSQVFNVSKNTFTYYDAEPLCKALGAELATYDQVKQSWEQGADWCNYGWVKGQMAVYPTQKDTYEKLQAGPEDQRMACGNPGLNGGFFDNPEMKFGVNCYGAKPSQSAHDANAVTKGTPQSPDALQFDKKVAHYKSEADNIGVMPFSTNKWSN